jgi:hypothetical protein
MEAGRDDWWREAEAEEAKGKDTLCEKRWLKGRLWKGNHLRSMKGGRDGLMKGRWEEMGRWEGKEVETDGER